MLIIWKLFYLCKASSTRMPTIRMNCKNGISGEILASSLIFLTGGQKTEILYILAFRIQKLPNLLST